MSSDSFDVGVVVPYQRRAKRKIFTLNPWKLSALLLLLGAYVSLVLSAVTLDAREQRIASPSDARWTANLMNRAFGWLFVPGPKVIEFQDQLGVTQYSIPTSEVSKWILEVALASFGWGVVLSIPTYIVTSIISKATKQDQQNLEKKVQHAQQTQTAQLHGRLEIPYHHYAALVTGTTDPVTSHLVQALQSHHDKEHWVLVQNDAMLNPYAEVVHRHVFLPDFSLRSDYTELLHAERLRDSVAILLSSKPEYKFLGNPEYDYQLDLKTGDIIAFIEQVRELTNNTTRFVVCGSSDIKIFSGAYVQRHQQEFATLGDVVSDLGATMIDLDEVIVREMHRRSQGRPISVEFVGVPTEVESARKRLHDVLARTHQSYPLKIVDERSEPTGGVFYIGNREVLGVALTQRKIRQLNESILQHIVFENIEQIQEVEELGFQALCVDRELVNEVVNVWGHR